MATIKKNVLKNGISYRIQVKAKSNETGEFETYVTTWKRPPGMLEPEVRRELQRVSIEFEDKVRKQAIGILAKTTDWTLLDFAKDRLIRMKSQFSPTTVIRETAKLKKFEQYFGNVKLKDLTPSLIQDFLDKEIQKKKSVECAVMKKKLKCLLKEKKLTVQDVVKNAKISKPLYVRCQRGERIMIESAKKICKYLKIHYSDYFDTRVEKFEYARATINAYRKSLCAILSTAKRQRLIDNNFASREYLDSIPGYKKEIDILNDEEAKKLSAILEKEPDLELRIAIMLPLYLGVRRGEISGLEWKDIDFNKNTIKIVRTSLRLSNYGNITKEPKTESSKREIAMPEILTENLKKYYGWWLQHKAIIPVKKAEWKDRLFIYETGEIYNSNIFRLWLQKLLTKHDMRDVTLHSLRHTNISLQLSAGVDLKTVASRVGHSQASTTSDIYSHFIKSSDIKASKVLDAIFDE